MSVFATPITGLPGITPRKAALLKKDCGVETYGDLLQLVPLRYVDRTRFFKVSEIQEDLPFVQLVGRLHSIQLQGKGKGKERLTAIFKDESGQLDLVWFQGIKWVLERIKPGTDYIIFGKPSVFNGSFNIAHPEVEPYSPERAARASQLQAVYTTSEGMKRQWLDSKGMTALISVVLRNCAGKIPESLPDEFRNNLQLIPLETAYLHIHQPGNATELQLAEQRLKFEELFFLQLRLLKINRLNKKMLKGYPFEKIGPVFNDFYTNHLPFTLTNAQKRVIKEIRADVANPIQMNRLIQGDVGSGKTIVAFMSMLMAIDNGFQACLMAPTEILATQHYNGLKDFADKMGVSIRLLKGATKKKDRDILHAELESGELKILVGTHALLEDKVKFANLGFVVIDEQHRFGVAQRAKLWAKNVLPPHVLIMSATPIPRTLAMTLYGDLDVSVIDELPPGRKEIVTKHYYDKDRSNVFHFIKREIAIGHQVYVVYPLIEESEQMDYRNLMEGYGHLESWFPGPQYHLSIVHGKLKSKDKEFEMQRFVNHQTHIMVATTVIEVGVNVPNASVMIIESAERFGLSQLHQLRGRVGRGADQSYCILMTGEKLSRDARTRIQTMVNTSDGFKIAETDMELRGPGDLHGTMQSGSLDLHIADISRDSELLVYCRGLANYMLDKDPDLELPEHERMRFKLEDISNKKANWARIS